MTAANQAEAGTEAEGKNKQAVTPKDLPQMDDTSDELSEQQGLVSALRSGLEKGAETASELKGTIQSQLSSLLQTSTGSGSDGSVANAPLAAEMVEQLIRQGKHSDQLITRLQDDLESSRLQSETLENKLAQHNPDATKVQHLIKQHRALEQQHKQLKQQVRDGHGSIQQSSSERGTKKAPDVVKVQELIKRYRLLKQQNQKLIDQRKEYKMAYQTQQSLITELQQQTGDNPQGMDAANSGSPSSSSTPLPAELFFDDGTYSDDGNGDTAMDDRAKDDEIEKLEKNLSSVTRLNEFLESHYLELIGTMPEGEMIKQEFEREKNEML